MAVACTGFPNEKKIFKSMSFQQLSASTYRVESSHPIVGPLWPSFKASKLHTFVDRAFAVLMAAKSSTSPSGHEIRVIHVPTGQVVFRKTAA
jgi:hypothetical protein